MKSFDEGLLVSLELLCLFLVLVDEAFFVVYLGLSLGLVGADLGLSEGLDRILALGDHGLYAFPPLLLGFLFLFRELLFAHCVFSQLLTHSLDALFLCHIHVVLGIVYLLPPHLLIHVGRLRALLGLLFLLLLYVLLPLKLLIVPLPQLDKFLCLFGRFLNFLLCFQVLLL